MGTYRLHRGWREPNGLVTDHATSGQTITAPSAYAAVAVALADGDFLLTEDTNLAWLTNEHGALVWSLRLDDEDLIPGS
ncbi:hypothetical protein OKC48_25770 [Methylorubrum extorquens]|uniref:hypothetical protein n=1 Tax=Methylorubrum extorquens TaxID=408 RepID=UPI0022387860|nr:hypothetical protein [Methylorubrum extorquens]UYW26618.1 hypothetical protein OKC48_25770 [Methylorubrum extorquens]